MKKDVESYLRTQLASTFGRHREGTRDVDNQNTVEFMKLFHSLIDSPTIADYESRLATCERMSHEATEYLKRYWLNRHKERLNRNTAINTTLAHGTGSRTTGTSLRMASYAASRYGADNNNDHSAIAVFFAESRATAAASPW
ncbi:hypothetical protein E4U58_004988, partial [Claviceps cyperi]